jgi:uncharacterized membrane protein YidH (DUF202 family)
LCRYVSGLEAENMAREQEILAKMRTLLALERNYMAEERTVLAEFRTGVTVALIAPSASAFIAYIFSVFPIRVIEGIPLLESLILTFLIILTAVGIWISFRSRSKLNKIKIKKKILKDRKVEVIRSSKAVCDLLQCELTDLID